MQRINIPRSRTLTVKDLVTLTRAGIFMSSQMLNYQSQACISPAKGKMDLMAKQSATSLKLTEVAKGLKAEFVRAIDNVKGHEYSSIIIGLLKNGEVSLARATYDDMIAEGYSPTTVILKCFLIYYVTQNNPIGGLKIYNQLVNDGAKVDLSVYRVLMKMLVDNPLDNDDVWERLLNSEDFIPASIIRHRAVSLLKSRRFKEASRLLVGRTDNLKSVYISMALAFKHNNDADNCVRSFDLMVADNHKHCFRTRGILMNLWRNERIYKNFAWEIKQYFLERNSRLQKLADKSIWYTIVSGFLSFKEWKKAARFMLEMEKMGMGLNKLKSEANGKYRQQTRRRFLVAPFNEVLKSVENDKEVEEWFQRIITRGQLR